MFDSGVLSAQGPRAANGKLNGKLTNWPKRAKRRRGFFSWASNLVARLAIWSAILTLLFRCPPSLEACDETSPYICKNYFLAKNVVAPRIQPYYHRYAAPYVHIAKPYYDALDGHVLTPTRTYALHFGAPWINRARGYTWSQWEIKGQPRLAQLQALSAAYYDRSIAPHLAQAGRIVEPYYGTARSNLLQLYYEYAIPSYELVHPHAVRGYSVARQFASNTALPATYWVWNKGNVFLETAVWPQLRSLYVENVEPQLVRIGERLGRYKNKAQSKVLHQQPSSTSFSSKPEVSSYKTTHPDSTPGSSAVEDSVVPDGSDGSAFQDNGPKYIHPVEPPTALENEDAEGRAVREMVTNDLEIWQEKFMSQAEEKAHEIEDRVDAIARRNMELHIYTAGKDLLEQLHSTVESEVEQLKRNIISIVKMSAEDAQDSAIAAVRSAGVAVKNSAQAIREWREKFDAQLKATVHDDVEEYFDILDETRSLALQKIGMKWAWTNGVSYHDWAKYHELKNALTKLTDDLRELVVTHPGLVEAQDASAHVEDEAMTIAADAARELARLKDVARWKILAGDSTDSFDSELMKLAAEKAGEGPAESQSPTDHGSKETLGKGFSPAMKPLDSVGETWPSTAAHSWSEEANHVSQGPNPPASGRPGGVSHEGHEFDKQKVSLEEKSGNTANDDETVDIGGHWSLLWASSANMAPDVSEQTPAAELDDSHDDEADAKTRPSQSGATRVNRVAFGAAAQEVSNRGPILDKVGEPDVYASATSAAQAAYSSAVAAASDRYSSALSVVSAQVYGTPNPVHKQLMASVSAACGNAVTAASQKLDKAVSAASYGVYGEPTPTSGLGSFGWDKVESIAAQRLNEGRLWAEVQYQSALMALGMATATASPTASVDKFVEQAKFRYYAGIGIAQDRYTSFLSAASSAWSSVTPTSRPTGLVGSASSVASVASESASSAAQAAGSVAQAAGSAAQSAYSAATEKVASAARAVEDSFSSVADAASEQMFLAGAAIAGTWDQVVSELSVQVYAEPTAIGWHDRLLEGAGSYASCATKTAADKAGTATEAAYDAADVASSQVAKQLGAVSKIVSELISGREPAFSESVLSRLGAIYATASASFGSVASEVSVSAASVGESVRGAASQATKAVKESIQQGRDEL
ncbi:hypothetical protein L249_6735 [Ophiocordyceps polyrhachis-furcata BCC 54312]|uniref:Transcription factor hoxa13 n=1 Tax=Ophiocordyceps polyrhachis-furcata BCC 54312 TaxID=1330021 RepID=A0A367LLP5_9HYPO|nr:hypothetical protein L249_6735 [Ophiocordyceps polyrhachis-furcata BCC 54312]